MSSKMVLMSIMITQKIIQVSMAMIHTTTKTSF
jgi:hypothetical protein